MDDIFDEIWDAILWILSLPMQLIEWILNLFD